MIPTKIRRQLEQVDWDFSEHLPGTSKTIHWYPGTYPADIPTTVIQALSKPGDLVFDPYGGTGTTALEAIRQLRKSWIVEANPVGCLASYVSCGALLIKSARKELFRLLIASIRAVLSSCETKAHLQFSIDTDLGVGDSVDSLLDILIQPGPKDFDSVFSFQPTFANLGDWIEKLTLRDIAAVLAAFEEAPIGAFGRLLGKTMISAILRPASSQTQSWGHIADNVWPKEFVRKDVFRLSAQWLSRFERIVDRTDVSPLPRQSQDEKRLWVSLHNWSMPNPPNVAPPIQGSLMVTSPPYAGAIDYTLAQRLSLYALGFADSDVTQLSKEEYGARRRRRQPHSLEAWAEELAGALEKQVEYMATPSFAAFVLPHKDEGRDVGAQIMEECLTSLKWEKLIEVDRSIRQVRARQSWTSIKRETIHIFGR